MLWSLAIPILNPGSCLRMLWRVLNSSISLHRGFDNPCVSKIMTFVCASVSPSFLFCHAYRINRTSPDSTIEFMCLLNGATPSWVSDMYWQPPEDWTTGFRLGNISNKDRLPMHHWSYFSWIRWPPLSWAVRFWVLERHEWHIQNFQQVRPEAECSRP